MRKIVKIFFIKNSVLSTSSSDNNQPVRQQKMMKEIKGIDAPETGANPRSATNNEFAEFAAISSNDFVGQIEDWMGCCISNEPSLSIIEMKKMRSNREGRTGTGGD